MAVVDASRMRGRKRRATAARPLDHESVRERRPGCAVAESRCVGGVADDRGRGPAANGDEASPGLVATRVDAGAVRPSARRRGVARAVARDDVERPR